MATFTWLPDVGASADIDTRNKEHKFGDGYEQVYGDGLNTIKETWNLSFSNREQSEYDAIRAFLKARAGVEVFDWTTPDGDAFKWRCKKWGRGIPVNGVIRSMTASFEQVFDN